MSSFRSWAFIVILTCLTVTGCLKSEEPLPNYGQAATDSSGAEAIAPWMSSTDMAFWNLDRDGDGTLTQAEFVASRGNEKAVKKATDLFAILDQDHDTKLTMQEFTKRPPQAKLCEYDADGDGTLGLKEFQRAELPRVSATRAARIFKIADRDADGKLSPEEYQKRAETQAAKFHYRDLDEDGRLSLEELVKAVAELAKNGQGAKLLAVLDRDQNGKVEVWEYESWTESFFVRDKDANGVLAMSEYATWAKTPEAIAWVQREFAQRDADGNGQLTLAEYHAAIERVPEVMLFRRDADRDGRLNEEEYLAGQKNAEREREVFALLDSDRDGQLTLAELRSNPPRVAYLRRDQDGDGTWNVAEYQASEARLSPARAERIFKAMDRDGDTKLSFKEYESRWSAPGFKFHYWDRDEDELLSLEELVKALSGLVKSGLGPKVLAGMDRNQDGKLDAREFDTWTVAFFEREKDGNGTLDVAEYTAWARSPAQQAGMKKEFAQRDADGNGQLTLEEYTAGRDRP